MGIPTGPPQAEEFGLTEEILAQTPDAYLVRHRNVMLVVVIALAMVAVTAALFLLGTSVIVSFFFAPILVAASLILTLPLALAAVCLAGSVETMWRSRSNPAFAACARYREAFERFKQDPGGDPESGRRSGAFWTMRSELELVEDVVLEIGEADVAEVDRESTGVDLVVRHEIGTWIVRCQAGRGPARGNVGRELAAALADLDGDHAVLVAPAGATQELKSYVRERKITILDASALASGGLNSLFDRRSTSA